MHPSSARTILNHAMAPLIQKYITHLEKCHGLIDELVTNAGDQKFSAENRETLALHAHNFAGSGATYGYPSISLAARELGDALADNEEDASVRSLSIAFMEQLQETIALSGIGRPPSPSFSANFGEEMDDTAKSAFKDYLKKEGQKKTVLVIDDDCAIVQMISNHFKNSVNVIGCEDGVAGLSLMEKYKPDLVLLDVGMPFMDGETVLKTMQNEPELARIPVLMITANSTVKTVIQAKKRGAIGYVTKPFDVETLAVRIGEVLFHSEKSVLLVEDDPSMRDLLAEKLRSAGVNLVLAASGPEAIELIKNEQPDLAIIGWSMPGLSATDLLRQLKKSRASSNTKFVVLSLKDGVKNVRASQKLGVVDFIAKPFTAATAVRRCLKVLQDNVRL